MKASQARIGRVFVIRLEHGDAVPACIEQFAREQGVAVGVVLLLGGIGGGQIVVGPRDSQAVPPEPMLLPVDGAHEVAAVGLLVPGPDGQSVLHIHGALGRSGHTMTGCLRLGVKTWLVGEAVLQELLDCPARRERDPATGFALLEPG